MDSRRRRGTGHLDQSSVVDRRRSCSSSRAAPRGRHGRDASPRTAALVPGNWHTSQLPVATPRCPPPGTRTMLEVAMEPSSSSSWLGWNPRLLRRSWPRRPARARHRARGHREARAVPSRAGANPPIFGEEADLRQEEPRYVAVAPPPTHALTVHRRQRTTHGGRLVPGRPSPASPATGGLDAPAAAASATSGHEEPP